MVLGVDEDSIEIYDPSPDREEEAFKEMIRDIPPASSRSMVSGDPSTIK
jgi:hypothetical protein